MTCGAGTRRSVSGLGGSVADMATFEIDDVDAEALRRLAERERRTVDDLAAEAVRDLVARRAGPGQAEAPDDLGAAIDRVRADRAFTDALDALVERDREILDRLAE